MAKTSRPRETDPLWYKDAVIYQLHIKSFYDANGDGIGDFRGLLQKLDYIVELGVTALWLLPFYPSPLRDDGYDIAEYQGVNPDYGSMSDVRAFIREAHARGLRVITELVINHTSDQHPWFQRARRAKPGSAARDFYVWSDTDEKYPETRIIFLDTEKSNWTWDEEAQAYYWHRFYSHQPDLNFDNPRVLAAIIKVMRFWLDLGVDGLRLDAVPYLVEREGTNNENLPETHAILKKIRAEIDARYPDRMLLAEANQWPEDTQEYFGDGDECHMAFHFPLMPRMYMAIAREDRFPITDIMRQTPEIPENCQWAIFLRNHDELTLEMVTDSERDYLWDFYAADRRARINLGIRRRLAPLMQRDRRRIELMNSLLLSMPGTPVIYYGDEIGMGDNIYLGDRDGVRTPMQWSPDRNGGFSKADPEQLILPVIQDPLYGFGAVNVESASRDPHSLLNWTRRMLGVRASTRAFGRGSLTFLRPGNRKVLAYVRTLDEEVILCVANLSRASQAVELDLGAWEGAVPVEMLGGESFPPIGELPYLLTLPPYGFYWFTLEPEGAAPPWHAETPEQMPEYTTLVMRRGLGEIVEARNAHRLEIEVLPGYLPKRRWFAAKDERLGAIRIEWAAPLASRVLALLAGIAVEVGGRVDRYLMPLSIVWESDNPPPIAYQLALARVRRGARVGYLTDAAALPEAAGAIITALRRGEEREASGGVIRYRATSRLADLPETEESSVRLLSAEQSNSSIVVDEAAVVKLIRRLREGVHPEVEMADYLTEAGYANTPPLLGEVSRIAADGTPTVLATVSGFVLNQGDAWHWTLDYLAREIESMAITGEEGGDEAEIFATYHNFAQRLGQRVGELHAVLARDTDRPEFRPVPADEEAAARVAETVRKQVEEAVAILRAGDHGAEAGRLVERGEELVRVADELADALRGSLLMRIHGDLHLGQVLVAQGDVYVIDFEGEPAKPLDERRRKASPMRDVAGVLRSFDYAVATALEGRGDGETEPVHHRREMLLARFRAEASYAFVEGYRAVLRAAERPWITPEAEPALLDLFLLEKAAYEICYEAANRPGWIGTPISGLAAIAERLLREDDT
ncbi:MAG TPA: maltose alpha-D-glucosyltransferase [Paracoccaceae bacterium]|nr:maltose alpha-D-glucosyltransferase [Paracoccaceae bacterium]